MTVESVFRSMAGADFNSTEGGGLSGAEFGAFLRGKSGADGTFNAQEFSETASRLGLTGEQSDAIMEAFGQNGNISVDKLRDQLNRSAGADEAFNLDEFKGGLERLVERAETRLENEDKPGADFGRDAGADKSLNEDEFNAMAENSGVDDASGGESFDEIAGADGEISEGEFEEAFGDTEVSRDDFASTMDEMSDDEEKPFAKFGRDAGADGVMDEEEFTALAEEAGVSKDDAKKAFDRIAGADGEISKEEFTSEDGLGSAKLSKEDFASKVEELAGAEETDDSGGADESGGADDAPEGGGGAPESGGSGGSGPSSGASPESSGDWSHEVKDGKATINLGDRYTITAEENDATWTVRNNETGHETRISGDPHVDVGNDGENDFDFKEDMSFVLDDGTKITVGTTPAGNGTTLTSELTITNGADAINVTGIGGDAEGNLKVVQSTSGAEMDDDAEDGFTIDEAGSGWTAPNGDVVDQQVIQTAEA